MKFCVNLNKILEVIPRFLVMTVFFVSPSISASRSVVLSGTVHVSQVSCVT